MRMRTISIVFLLCLASLKSKFGEAFCSGFQIHSDNVDMHFDFGFIVVKTMTCLIGRLEVSRVHEKRMPWQHLGV
jgi:hypothetical protein